jgi:hypothetical protein
VSNHHNERVDAFWRPGASAHSTFLNIRYINLPRAGVFSPLHPLQCVVRAFCVEKYIFLRGPRNLAAGLLQRAPPLILRLSSWELYTHEANSTSNRERGGPAAPMRSNYLWHDQMWTSHFAPY